MSTSRLRQVGLICLILCLGFLGPACARAPDPTGAPAPPAEEIPPPPAPGEGVVTLRLLALGQDSTLDAMISAFYARYPHYRISKQFVPWDVQDPQAYVAEQLSKGGIDLVQLESFGPSLAAGGKLVNLDPYLKASQVDTAPYGDGLSVLRAEGGLFELPTIFQPVVLLYNPRLFAEASVAPPPDGGWTWVQFRETLQGLTDRKAESPRWGFSAPLTEQLVRRYFLGRSDMDLRKLNPGDVLDGLSYFRALVEIDRSMAPSERRRWESARPMLLPQNEFFEGKAAMTIDYLNFTRPWSANPQPWDVAPYPSRYGWPAPLEASPRTYGIAGSSTQRGAAWEFLKFISGAEGAVAAAAQGQLHLYNTPAAKEAWFARKPAPPAGTALLFTLPRQVQRATTDKTTQELIRLLNLAANRVLSLTMEPVEADLEFRREARPYLGVN